MTHTARLVLTVICVVVSAGTELAGVALVVAEARRVGRVLRGWRDATPDLDRYRTAPELQRLATGLLGNSFDRTSAAAFVLTGIVTGAIGALLALGL